MITQVKVHLIPGLSLDLALDETRGGRISSLTTSGPQEAPTLIHLGLCGTNPPSSDVTRRTTAAGRSRPRNQRPEEDLLPTGGGGASSQCSTEGRLRLQPSDPLNSMVQRDDSIQTARGRKVSRWRHGRKDVVVFKLCLDEERGKRFCLPVILSSCNYFIWQQ